MCQRHLTSKIWAQNKKINGGAKPWKKMGVLATVTKDLFFFA